MINLDSRRAANDVPDIPHTTLSDAELREIGWLISGADLQRRIDSLAKRCVELTQANALLRAASGTMNAHDVWCDLAAKADEEGAFHRDDVLAILKKHGAV